MAVRTAYARSYYQRMDKERHRRNARVRRARLQVFLNGLKAKPCADCGGSFPPECMDFDHVRGDKRKGVGALVHVSERVLLMEIAKCELVCANCHRIRTGRRRQEAVA